LTLSKDPRPLDPARAITTRWRTDQRGDPIDTQVLRRQEDASAFTHLAAWFRNGIGCGIDPNGDSFASRRTNTDRTGASNRYDCR
jgi:hypothetical protein